MQRYVIINHRSGYITAMLHASHPCIACRQVDEVAQMSSRTYEIVSSLNLNELGYRVYDADGGCAIISTITDGENAHLIELIEQECPLIATIRVVE